MARYGETMTAEDHGLAVRARWDQQRVDLLGLGPAVAMTVRRAEVLRDLLSLAIDSCRLHGEHGDDVLDEMTAQAMAGAGEGVV
jgi:hypothetical protein